MVAFSLNFLYILRFGVKAKLIQNFYYVPEDGVKNYFPNSDSLLLLCYNILLHHAS